MQKALAIPKDFSDPFWEQKKPLTDSRQLQLDAQMVFIALKGSNHDGHDYIADLYQRGIQYFIVEEHFDTTPFPQAAFLKTAQPLIFLQQWAKAHREKHSLDSIGITGSNGKTIVKEYLYQLLEQDWRLVKSPKSYNSQLGVPLSVLQIRAQHQVGIFEAGISQPHEMQRIAHIIAPQIGIFTNIGAAHASGFSSIEEKTQEKLDLFEHCTDLIYCKDHQLIDQAIQQRYPHKKLWSWGTAAGATIPIQLIQQAQQASMVQLKWQGKSYSISLPFKDAASIENSLHSVVCLLLLEYSIPQIQQRLQQLKNIPMRLEWKAGIEGCMLIDDSYNNDLVGLKIALDFMHGKSTQHPRARQKTLILSDIAETALEEQACYAEVAQLVQQYGIQKLIGIGPALLRQQKYFQDIPNTYFFENTAQCLQQFGKQLHFQQETILLKGARAFEFEQLVRRLRRRSHQTVLEFDLQALTHNFNSYRQLLTAGTKIMVMVKAFAYGSSSYEIARLLEEKGVDYLGVAYTDEGVQLRLEGIQCPIMVMNPNADDFQDLLDYNLEPAVYSLELLHALHAFMQAQASSISIQIELDTGMHRLGFEASLLQELLSYLQTPYIQVSGIFSHLAAADEDLHEDFSKAQIKRFLDFSAALEKALGYATIKHILNSAGISRFAHLQLDMVRLGIGLHGIDPNAKVQGLRAVARLRTVVSQVKQVAAGASVGYARASISDRDRTIATLAIGYADGLMRAFSRGIGKVWVKGHLCPIVGNICMDMCFIDVTGLGIQAGDEAVIFGKELPVEVLAAAINSIPYEILTSISQRVPRIFYEA